MWFWSRRPKLMFYSRTALMLMVLCVLISLSIALVNWHLAWVPKRAGEVIVILLEVAVEIYAIRHRLRFLRWRREYERSIDRLLRTIYPGV
jgi:membrane protein YdbS with pleckstrin-like domain